MAVRYSKYRYVKAGPPQALTVTLARNKTTILSGGLMFLGIGIISWVVWPILSFKLLVAPKFAQLIEPIPRAKSELNKVATSAVRQVKAQVVEDTSVDYTKASNWFPQLKQEETDEFGTKYTISIPKLKIDSSTALVGGDDLSESLIHYGGTSLPGEYGNAVVFGHSTLPYFYDPSNYTTVFSTLPTLEKGDDIYVEHDGLRYKYIVEEMIVVEPKDVQILEQRFDDSYLTLVTCVPPGTYLERLVVRARLQKI
jgi:sortase A